MEQLEAFPEAISSTRNSELMAYFEASIDFPEDEIDTIATMRWMCSYWSENKIKDFWMGFLRENNQGRTEDSHSG